MEKPEDEESFRTLKTKVETKETELYTKENELIRIEAELQQLLDDKDTMEEEVALNELLRICAALIDPALALGKWWIMSRQKIREEIQRRTEEAQSNINILQAKSKEEKQRRQDAEKEVKSLKSQLESVKNELEEQKQKTAEEQKKREAAESKVKRLQSQLDSMNSNNNN
ncbi:myosin-11-like [Mugil cephalus]|uniref:myosin-11-like n=1 Tax=Mugil cephalus TaxID=48193 RepID=UPI001FB6BCB5|nr:myosin-11-like [Mugil cephalus]